MKSAQLIDFEGNFLHHMFLLSPVETWMVEQGLADKGFGYSVVTVLGCQSSGKSTLLNELFGTEFAVMDASVGRNQTTKGLWLGRDSSEPTLIIDVEGTDSRERGEDRLTFEHRAALFSLALADVVVVNMWYHDLGRYTASHYGLLKTVLGVQLKLFQQQEASPKTIMLFVIRDYSETGTSLEILTRMINDDIRKIWKETSKPDHLQTSTADDFFVFKTVGLPSRLDMPDAFKEKCTELKEMLCKYLPTSYTHHIPADGFGLYSRSVWETILKSSELDIPSQKGMLATYRCEEIKNAAIAETLPAFPAYLTAATKGSLSEDFGWAAELIEGALSMYDRSASRYQAHECLKKRQELLQSLQAELQKIIDAHVTHVWHRVAVEASVALAGKLVVGEDLSSSHRLEAWRKFNDTGNMWMSVSLEKFDETTSSLYVTCTVIDPDTRETTSTLMEFEYSLARQALKETLEAMLLREREKQIVQFDAFLGSFVSPHIETVNSLLAGSELTVESFWSAVDDLARSTRNAVIKDLTGPYMGLQTPLNAQEDKWHAHVTDAVAIQIRDRLDEIGEWLQNDIFARFLQFFEQDDEGVPRQWQDMNSDKVKEIYFLARERAMTEKYPAICRGKTSFVPIKCESAVLCVPVLSESKKVQALRKAEQRMQFRRSLREALVFQALREALVLQAMTGVPGAHLWKHHWCKNTVNAANARWNRLFCKQETAGALPAVNEPRKPEMDAGIHSSANRFAPLFTTTGGVPSSISASVFSRGSVAAVSTNADCNGYARTVRAHGKKAVKKAVKKPVKKAVQKAVKKVVPMKKE